MARYAMSAERHAAIFGAPSEEEPGVGRSRLCKTCGGWHKLNAWPHNCRPPRHGPTQRLAAPMLAPTFNPFKTGVLDNAEVIGSRNEKREYMKRNDLVEYDSGVGERNEWVEQRDNEREIVSDIKRFRETDSENLPPDLKAQRMEDAGALDGASEVQVEDVEIVT